MISRALLVGWITAVVLLFQVEAQRCLAKRSFPPVAHQEAANEDAPEGSSSNVDWEHVGNDPGGARYAGIDQIHRGNVADLEVAWTYHTGELKRGGKTIECTPLVIDGVMYITTAYLRVIALDAATGAEKWVFDPFADGPAKTPIASGGVNRGLAWWSDGEPGGARRVLHGSAEGRLFSIDARSGKLDPQFADGGVLELRNGLERDVSRLSYGPTSAPAVCGDVVILGLSVGEGPGVSAPGDVRAFSVRTGEQVWRFHTVPRPGEFGHDTWASDSWVNRGGANAWGGVSVDPVRGWAFFGVGSAAFDFYGGDRHGDNLFANCVVAVDASTGERQWHFQTTHHDLWDYDIPVRPALVQVRRGDKLVDAVAQVTKTGYLFLLDRDSGEPLFDVEERPVPESTAPGELASSTQPVPVKPPPFSRTSFGEEDVTDISEEANEAVLARLRELRHDGPFAPPSLQGTVVTPGFHGGANWSGASFDPESGLLFVNANDIPNVLTLVESPEGSRHRYRITGYHKFQDPEGYPAIKPPWGTLTAIDLEQGTFRWRVILGEHEELTARGIPQTGTETFGGTIATSGGLVFIGGTADERFHAFDSATGELLWQTKLPAGGYATPCTYQVAGRQFVCIAAGGAGKIGTKAGDSFVAFALPSPTDR